MQNYKIIYKDSSILVAAKPQGLATTPGKLESLCDHLFEEEPRLKEVKGYKEGEGGLLNRLDNETGGLVLFALSNESFSYYSDIMQEGRVAKYYRALVDGLPPAQAGVIDTPIAHHHKSKKKMIAVTEKRKHRGKARAATTSWQLVGSEGGRSLLDLLIKKGGRHQIRVHLSHQGLPIVGDKLYNRSKVESPRFHRLYAYRVVFTNLDGRITDISVPLPF